jgi:p-aminobenzoyl-glutamate transporter AbgT
MATFITILQNIFNIIVLFFIIYGAYGIYKGYFKNNKE